MTDYVKEWEELFTEDYANDGGAALETVQFPHLFMFPLLNTRSFYARRVKRIIDLAGGIVGLLLFSPLLIGAAIAVKLISPRAPVIYVQKRIGYKGTPFRCYKLRTMIPGAEEVLKKWAAENPELYREYTTDYKLRNDPRVIPVIGRFLRESSIDEIPQFFNVLKGDMSLIGPRPIVKNEKKKYGKWFPLIASAKPGISGLWQVSGRNNTDYRDRVKIDIRYVKDLSFYEDCYVLGKTFKVLFHKYGAY